MYKNTAQVDVQRRVYNYIVEQILITQKRKEKKYIYYIYTYKQII